MYRIIIPKIKILMVVLVPLLFTSCSKTNIDAISTFISRTQDPLEPYVATMNVGYSKVFLGKCLFINVFLSDSESSFDKQEIQDVMDYLEQTANYFDQQSKKYDKQLSIVYNEEDLILKYKTDFIIPTDINDYLWIFDLIENIYSQYNVIDISKKYNADNISFLFHVNKTGVSYSLVQEDGYDSQYDKETSVVFTSILDIENNVVNSTEFTYAHEILHLFGAIDLYYPFNPNDERIGMAEAYFSNDIMLSHNHDIDIATIGNVDAYLIGWDDCLEKENIVYVSAPYS